MSKYYGYKYTIGDTKKSNCSKCSGTGIYNHNHRKEFQGKCFACDGKGWVSHRDYSRTQSYYDKLS